MEDIVMQEATASSFMFPPPPVESRSQMRRPRVYTKEEWEAQKNTIEQLYIIERKSLKEVTEFLGHNFGFYATYA
jgi:hypothetical protein